LKKLRGKPAPELCHLTQGRAHTMLSAATRHKWTRPALTPGRQPGTHLPTPEGWKAELI